MTDKNDFDAIVIGTGFGGAVTACRLAEAGFRICVLERGRRYGPADYPRYPTEDLFGEKDDPRSGAAVPDLARWVWTRDQGLYDVRDLDDVIAVQAAGYGGGSLVYANVHLRPPKDVFSDAWPEEYRMRNGESPLDEYFDLAAYMLRAGPVPSRLEKTIRLQEAASSIGAADGWFRTPLAVNFESFANAKNSFERTQQPCDMRARCWVGCDREAKNTLDKNYLAKVEDHDQADIRTLAEVTEIVSKDGRFVVSYDDLVLRGTEDESTPVKRARRVTADWVFLCAGALNTTDLLLKNWNRLHRRSSGRSDGRKRDAWPVGSHYFPNGDSLGAVFDSDKPHEADYGPTITAAVLHQGDAPGEFGGALDFYGGEVKSGPEPRRRKDHVAAALPAAGMEAVGKDSGARATLSHAPVLDWGSWQDGTAVGALVLDSTGFNEKKFVPGERVCIGQHAMVTARSSNRVQAHWFMAQDGGYPPDLEPLIGVLQSPLWVRRNRYIERPSAPPPVTPTRRPRARLRLEPVSASLLGTQRRTGTTPGVFNKALGSSSFNASGLLASQIRAFFPDWFIEAFERDRKELLDLAAALALPMLGELLGELSKAVAVELNSGTVERGLPFEVDKDRKEVMVRGLLRQALQVLAGSEAAVATKAAQVFLKGIPATPEGLLNLVGEAMLWAFAYGPAKGHTGLILTMGRDQYRGRLRRTATKPGELKASLPGRLLDTSAAMQERVLRRMAATGWKGELRTNPAWTIFDKRVTVHNQGGCPMGPRHFTSGDDVDRDLASVTDTWGEVHACPGLYVMDAAAFPVSVGVNPSAAIAAIAEFKIEHFIRTHATSRPDWTATEKGAAKAWVDQARLAIDPLNHPPFTSGAPARPSQQNPRIDQLGLIFREKMTGNVADLASSEVGFDDLVSFPEKLSVFRKADATGTAKGSEIIVELTVNGHDLSRLVATAPLARPFKMSVEGSVEFHDRSSGKRAFVISESESFLQLFVETDPPSATKFFRYHVVFGNGTDCYLLKGLKVLRDSPGLDLWSDATTVYFEISAVAPESQSSSVRRGILRVSIEDFLKVQLRGIAITGTNDATRKVWALVAFYKYFIGQLSSIYLNRVGAMKAMLIRLLSSANV